MKTTTKVYELAGVFRRYSIETLAATRSESHREATENDSRTNEGMRLLNPSLNLSWVRPWYGNIDFTIATFDCAEGNKESNEGDVDFTSEQCTPG
jgi:hypothetical protein